MSETKRPAPAAGYQVETLDGEIVLFHPASSKILHSNPSGALIWQLCDGQRTVTEIVALIQEAYPDAGPGEIEADVQATLAAFAAHGTIAWA
jgi:hypothetical protein